MHRSMFLSGQAIQNTKCVGILEKVIFNLIKSLSYIQFCVQKLFFRNKFKCTYIKKEGRGIISQTDIKYNKK